MINFVLVALSLGDVRIAYTVDFGGYDVYCDTLNNPPSGALGYQSKLCNATLPVPYQIGDVNHVDFVTGPSYLDDIGFFDTAWWGLDSATIDTSGNLFVTSRYHGRASGDHTGSTTKQILAKGDCFTDSQMVTFSFCYKGLA